MKRFIILLSCLLLSVPQVFGQVSVTSGNPSVNVNVKRAIMLGDDVYVDMIIKCQNNWEKIIFSTSNMYPSCRVYDDEGNLYQSGDSGVMVFESDGKRSHWFPELVVERDVPRKIRIVGKNVDEYATMFTKALFHYYADRADFLENEYVISINNLPIERQ